MKKLFLILTILFLNQFAFSQNNTFPNSGNAGIGTTTPQAILDIKANGNIPVIRGNGGYIPTGLRFIDDSYTLSGQVKEWAIFKGNTWAKGLGFMRYDAVDRCNTGICDIPLFLADNGNIGLMTHIPSDRLTIGNGNLNIQSGDLLLINYNNRFVGHSDRANYYLGHYPVTGSSGLDIHWYGGIKFGTSSGDVMQILQNGNVGIGTNNPGTKLEVKGDITTSQGAGAKLTIFDNNSIRNNRLQFYANENGANIFSTYSTGGTSAINFVMGSGLNVMKIDDNGNVGISKVAPTEKLEVAGNVFVSDPNTLTGVQVKSRIPAVNSQTYAQLGWGESTMGIAGDLVIAPRTDIGCGIRFFTNNGSAIAERFKIAGNGNASLQGKFEAKEIKVTTTPTADFVFEETYNLPKLEEVEKHIKDKKHLPEIASAKEMEKEGVNVGEFQIKLLQKIEELTLYIIEQDKKNKKLEKEVEQLKKQINK